MQRDLDGELERLLHAIGARAAAGHAAREAPAHPHPSPNHTARDAARSEWMVKAGSDDLAAYLSNWDEVDAYLRPWPCLHRMLSARGPVAFELDACEHEVHALTAAASGQGRAEAGARRDMELERERRLPRILLNSSECAGS